MLVCALSTLSAACVVVEGSPGSQKAFLADTDTVFAAAFNALEAVGFAVTVGDRRAGLIIAHHVGNRRQPSARSPHTTAVSVHAVVEVAAGLTWLRFAPQGISLPAETAAWRRHRGAVWRHVGRAVAH